MKRSTAIIVFSLTLCLALPAATEKLCGKSLYDNWQKLEIVKTTGTTQVTWLPLRMGYLESESKKEKGNSFFRVDPATGKRLPCFDAAMESAMLGEFTRLTGKKPAGLPFSSFTFLDPERGIRFTVDGNEYIFLLAEKKMRLMKLPRAPAGALMAAQWIRQGKLSPDYSRFAYVKDYDLWLFDTQTGLEEPLTSGGSESLRNGCCDWVYGEELDQTEAIWWSPDGRALAYLQFDEGAVFSYPLVHDLTPEHLPAIEAILETERYPKAGKANPAVRLFVIDPATKKQVEIQSGHPADNYITRIAWRLDNSEILFQRLNRPQNKLELMAGDPHTGALRTILVEEDPCFINLDNDFRQLKDRRRFVWSSERSGWKHLYLYDFSGRLLSSLTRGEWEALKILRIDEEKGWLYFSVAANDGFDLHLGRVRLDGRDLTRLTREPGTHRISMDPAARYYLDSFSSLTSATQVTLHSANGRRLRNLATSNIEKVKELGLVEPERIALKAADDTTDIFGILFKPAGFDPAKKYPMIVQVYGGPSRRNFNVYQAAAAKAQLAQLGFIVWELDGRGTLRRGKKFLTQTYLKFGQVDVDDQATAVRQLCRTRPYIDGSRIAMTGGSYGGYMTCMSLLRYPDLYAAGLAIAPVTDWRSYDSIYTERYMGMPEANPEGYEKGSALTYAKNLKGKLLLVHGSVDNNVHPGNTMHLVEALQQAGKNVELMIYPEHRHGVDGSSAQHLAKLRLDFFFRYLQPEAWQESLRTVW